MSERLLADKEGVEEKEVKINAQFSPPLGLLGVDWVQVEVEELENDHLEQNLRIKVPDGTQYVHVNIKSMDVAFGNRKKNIPRPVGSVWTQIKLTSWSTTNKLVLSGGHCMVNFKAVLQDAAVLANAGKWSGWFDLEIMCFGIERKQEKKEGP
jgi:hypothetical protein